MFSLPGPSTSTGAAASNAAQGIGQAAAPPSYEYNPDDPDVLFSGMHRGSYLTPTDELWKLTEVFLKFPGNKNYPFHATFLNLPAEGQQNPGPAGDRDLWEWLTVKRNAKDMTGLGVVPVEAEGFPDLRDRMLAQTEQLSIQQAFIDKLQGLVDQFQRIQHEKVTNKLKEMQENMVSHQHRLLKVVRKLDALEYKFAKEWHQGRYTQMDTQKIQSLLQQYNSDLAPTSGGGLKERVDNLTRTARLRKGVEASHQGPGVSIESKNQEEVVEIYHFLQGHIEGARAMQDTVMKLRREMGLMLSRAPDDNATME